MNNPEEWAPPALGPEAPPRSSQFYCYYDYIYIYVYTHNDYYHYYYYY